MNVSRVNVSIVPYYPSKLSYAPQPSSKNITEQIFMLCIIFLLVLILLISRFNAKIYLQRHLNRAQNV